MRGGNMGTLGFDFYGNGQWFNDVFTFTTTTPSSAGWYNESLDIIALEPGMAGCDDCQIRIKATVGNGYQSDIAIDNFRITDSSSKTAFDDTNNLETLENSMVDFGLYPNPATDLINMEFEDIEQISQIMITNVLGQNTEIPFNSTNGNVVKMDISQLNPGYYVVSVLENSGNVVSKKLIVN